MILCKLFGHKPPIYAKKGWYSPGKEYGSIINIVTDGIGREHAQIQTRCPRCKELFMICRVHLPKQEDQSM